MLHIFEAMLPLPYLFPGAKLGLANIISLFVLLLFGFKDALLVSFLRTILGGLMSGTFLTITFWLSFSGGIASTLVMGACYRLAKGDIGTIGLSVVGALTHNLAQITVAALLIGNWGIFVYLPYLIFFALPTGFFVGLVTNQLERFQSGSIPRP
ncbi:MAG: Gx transporter family protein [Firmicutes bacterium]|nr:Gx transporter family protein [Bacillota bacterium]